MTDKPEILTYEELECKAWELEAKLKGITNIVEKEEERIVRQFDQLEIYKEALKKIVEYREDWSTDIAQEALNKLEGKK